LFDEKSDGRFAQSELCGVALTETVAQSNSFRQFDESFDQTFSKVCGVKGEKPFSLSKKSP